MESKYAKNIKTIRKGAGVGVKNNRFMQKVRV